MKTLILVSLILLAGCAEGVITTADSIRIEKLDGVTCVVVRFHGDVAMECKWAAK
jgi:hypothetical protein